MTNFDYLSKSIEAARIASAERYYEAHIAQPVLSICPGFQEYYVSIHGGELPDAAPFTPEAFEVFGKHSPVVGCRLSEPGEYIVTARAGLEERELAALLRPFIA